MITIDLYNGKKHLGQLRVTSMETALLIVAQEEANGNRCRVIDWRGGIVRG